MASLHLKMIQSKWRSSIAFASKALTSHHEISASEMGKPRSADTAPIRPVGSITVEMKRREVRGVPDDSIAQLTKLDRRPFLLWVLRWLRTSLRGARNILQRISVERNGMSVLVRKGVESEKP